MQCRKIWLTCACLIFAVGCQTPLGPTDDIPSVEGFFIDPTRLPSAPSAADFPDGGMRQLALSQILISYQGSSNPSKRTWSRAQARMRAEAIAALARVKGMDFGSLAHHYSDDTRSRELGGDMAVFTPGELHPDVERAGFALGLGKISDPVETGYGFHILLRHEPTEAQAFDMLISYDGAQNAQPRQSRTREQAKKLAEDILSRLRKGADFVRECLRYSDHGDSGRAGFRPIFRKGTQNPQFEKNVWSLPIDSVSSVIETPTGFHIIRRYPVERIQVRQIVISYRANAAEQTSAVRGREQAAELIAEAYTKATARNADFAALVSEYSESAEKSRGGLLEPAGRAQHDLRFEEIAFSLPVGGVSRPFEIDNGFYLIKRVR